MVNGDSLNSIGFDHQVTSSVFDTKQLIVNGPNARLLSSMTPNRDI